MRFCTDVMPWMTRALLNSSCSICGVGRYSKTQCSLLRSDMGVWSVSGTGMFDRGVISWLTSAYWLLFGTFANGQNLVEMLLLIYRNSYRVDKCRWRWICVELCVIAFRKQMNGASRMTQRNRLTCFGQDEWRAHAHRWHLSTVDLIERGRCGYIRVGQLKAPGLSCRKKTNWRLVFWWVERKVHTWDATATTLEHIGI